MLVFQRILRTYQMNDHFRLFCTSQGELSPAIETFVSRKDMFLFYTFKIEGPTIFFWIRDICVAQRKVGNISRPIRNSKDTSFTLFLFLIFALIFPYLIRNFLVISNS